MKKRLIIVIFIIGVSFNTYNFLQKSISLTPTNIIVEAARAQIGVVTKYDTSYYSNGYPPNDRGACSDVVVRALLDNNYNLKEKIDLDMKDYPEMYVNEYDSNINFRRVLNMLTYFNRFEESLTTSLSIDSLDKWQAGDIIIYDKIPDGLWHTGIISNKKNRDGLPLLIHNHGRGTVENDLISIWPAPIIGHFRIILKNDGV